MELFSEEAQAAFTVERQQAQTSSSDNNNNNNGEPARVYDEEENDDRSHRQSKRSSADADARTVFCGNVPLAAKKSELKQHFAAYGKIESIRKRSIPITGAKVRRVDLVVASPTKLVLVDTAKIGFALSQLHSFTPSLHAFTASRPRADFHRTRS